MQISEFIEANNRLEHYYEKEYTTEQRQIMYEELKDFSIERYRKLVSECIKTCKYLPKIADFIKANLDLKEIRNDTEMMYREKCEICNGSGYITYYRKLKNNQNETIYTYAARCVCENGQNACQKIKTFKELGVRPKGTYMIEER